MESRGREAGPVLPWRTLRPPPFPMPGWAWGSYVVCGCCRASSTARANASIRGQMCLRRLCPIRHPFILLSILSSIILWMSRSFLKLLNILAEPIFLLFCCLKRSSHLSPENYTVLHLVTAAVRNSALCALCSCSFTHTEIYRVQDIRIPCDPI